MTETDLYDLLAGIDGVKRVSAEIPEVQHSDEFDLPMIVFSLQESGDIPTLDEGPIELVRTYSILILTEKHSDLGGWELRVRKALTPATRALNIEITGDDEDSVVGFHVRGLRVVFAA